MSDDADITEIRGQLELDLLINAARQIVPPGSYGECDQCGEESRIVEGMCSQCRDRIDRVKRQGYFR